MKKGLLALALGTFGLGMTEYVMMSILPDLAHDFHVGIPQAGHLISAYAIGVCIGAPAVAIFMRNWPLKRILLILMAGFAVGNLLFASSATFAGALVARTFTGLPHGAFFGAGSIVASRLMPGKQTTAVALMTLGMTVANLAGIPVGSFVANNFNWRWIFLFNAVWGILTLFAILRHINDAGALSHTTVKGEFRFLGHVAPWLLIAATVLCQGGAFAMYSYVGPIMQYAGLSLNHMPEFMIAVGLGMCIGNYFSGRVSDRITPPRATLCIAAIITVALAFTFIGRGNLWFAGGAVILVATMLFALSSPMQLLLIENSPGGELMGGAMVQVAFNLGNAIGAYFGGLPIAAGHTPSSSALVGVLMSALSIPFILYFMRHIKSSNE